MRSSSKPRRAALAVIAVLLVAGCGGSHQSSHDAPGADAPRPKLLDVAAIAAAAPAPGGSVQSGGVVARVGSYPIYRSALESRMSIEAAEEPAATRVLPVPPSYTGCIAYLERYDSAQKVAASSLAALRGRCATLYHELLRRVLGSLISDYWVIGGAAEEGIVVSDGEVRKGLERDLAGVFGSEAKAQKYIAATRENTPDLLFNERVRLLEAKIRARVNSRLGPITPARIARYYAENKGSFAVKATRTLGLLRTKKAASARQIVRELREGVSFATIYRRLIHEQPFYTDEGLLSELPYDTFKEGTLNHALFAAKLNTVGGPVRLDVGPHFDFRSARDIQDINGYYIFKAFKETPAYVKSFAQVKSSIATELAGSLERQAIAAYIGPWRVKWRARSVCAPGFVVHNCSAYVPVPGEGSEDPYTLN
jgi:hypothetical protein